MAMVAIARPALGLPAIIDETEMPIWHPLFSLFWGFTRFAQAKKAPSNRLRLRVLRVGHRFLDSLAKRIDVFGTEPDGGFPAAGTALRDGFFAAFAQAALKSIPAPSNSDRAVADYDRIGSRWHHSVRHRRGRLQIGLACSAAHGCV